MKKTKEFKDIVLPVYLLVNILYLFIGSYLVSIPKVFSMKKFSYGYIGLLIVNCIIITLIFIFKKYKKNKIDIFLILIGIFAFFSFVFAYDRHVALFGTFYRFEGLFMILYYMSIAFISSFVKEKYKKYIIYTILLGGFAEFLIACCQKLNLFNVYTYVVGEDRHSSGFTDNANFFATLMLICLSIVIGLLFDNKDNKKIMNVIYIILIVFYTIGLLFANTTSCIVGLIFVLLYLIYYCKKNKFYKKLIVLLVIIVTISISITYTGFTNQISDLNRATIEIGETIIGKGKPEYGTARVYIWSRTLKLIPRHIFFGIGIDNFKYIFYGRPIPYWTIIDKCHNEYLQILATMGIFSLISYLCLYYNIVKEGIKNSLKNKELYLILPVIGYLVQAFFNISVIEVAPLFYIILGLNIDRYSKSVKNN